MLLHHRDHLSNQQSQSIEWQTLYHQCRSVDPVVAGRAYCQLRKLLLPRARYCLYTKPSLQVEVDDCVQEALVDIWKNLTAHRGPTGQAQSFQSWCITIVSRKVFDMLRQRAYRIPEACSWDADEDECTQPSDVDFEQTIVHRLAIYTLLYEVLNHPNLNTIQRQVLWLQCVEDLDYAEIAQRLHKTTTTIRVNRHRAIITLQKDSALMARVSAIIGEQTKFSRFEPGRQGIDW